MRSICDIAPDDSADGVLLVMLPGATHQPQDLVSEGFIAALRERRSRIEVVVADAHVGYYLERSVVERLAADVISPARARNHRKLWLMGISLGGLGALMYARMYAGEVEGVILLAPYLGVPGLIGEVARAGSTHGSQAKSAHRTTSVACLHGSRPIASTMRRYRRCTSATDARIDSRLQACSSAHASRRITL
jgi:alpha-beta hydrolase superfamily lysophospholipase